MSGAVRNAVGELKIHTIDPQLCDIECSRSVWNRTAAIYHVARATLTYQIEGPLLFVACMSYALKECCASTNFPALLELRKSVSEVDAAAVEVVLFEYVRPHVVLIESCLRLQLKTLTQSVPRVYSVREPIARIALALSQQLYTCSFCRFPETCARACLLVACSLYPVEVDCSTLPAEFRTPLLSDVSAFLFSSLNSVQKLSFCGS
jgi:hypothetical protein